MIIFVYMVKDKVHCKPTSFLGGKNFESYLGACKIAGYKFDRDTKSQVGDIRQVPTLCDELNAQGFRIDIEDEVRETMKEYAREMTDPADHLAHYEALLGERGLAMYPYQREGVMWLQNEGTCIFHDEMGLGKTMQILLSLPDTDLASLAVVAPASLLGVWEREIRMWRPDINPVVLRGKKSFRWPELGEAVIISYSSLPSPSATQISLGPGHAVTLVADEAHYLKRFKSQRTKNFRAMSKKARELDGNVILATGTPLLNKPPELWSIAQAASLGSYAWGSWDRFVKAFGGYKARFGYEWDNRRITPDAEAGLRRIALGRRRKEVLPDLPGKRWQNIETPLVESAKEDLDEIWEAFDSDLDFTLDDLNREIEFSTISSIRKAIATMKIPVMLEQVELYEENEEPLVVFSAHRAPVDTLAERDGWEVITGDTPVEKRTQIEDDFQAGKLKGVAGTIQAMGTGLTLTHAACMLFVDLAWTPALNAQAEDRICRIGQDRGCLYTTLVADHPLEYRIAKLLQTKEGFVKRSVDRAAGSAPVQSKRAALLEMSEAPSQATRPEAPTSTEPQGDFSTVVGAMDKGARMLKFPKMKLQADDGRSIVFARASAKSKNPGAVHVKAPGGFSAEFYGWIFTDGTTTVKDPAILRLMGEMQTNLEETLAKYGHKTGTCGCCGRELTNPASIERGIGPVCAERYGL